jgi:hypothetical protein
MKGGPQKKKVIARMACPEVIDDSCGFLTPPTTTERPEHAWILPFVPLCRTLETLDWLHRCA